MSRIQNYFSSEFLATGLNKDFYDFITKLTQSKSKTEEASHVTEQIAKLQSKMSSPDTSSSRMKDYLIRLIHCYMLGYNVDFSIIYAIMTTQSGESALDRRVGYLICTLFLKEEELSIMLINTLQRDLKSQNHLDKCAALNAICYLEHNELLDNVFDFVVQAMEFPKQIVRKKAVMTLYCLYEKSNMDIDRIELLLKNALHDKDSSVVFAALSVWKMILLDHANKFHDVLPVIHSIHKQIIEKRIHKSFTYHGVLAPWAQLDCLQIYEIYHDLNIGSPQDFYNIIVDCLKSMERKVDAAFAIVLECVRLLSSIDPILLGSLAGNDDNPFELLDWYLRCKNHNLKYLGILSMSFVDESFWKKEWLDGSLLSEIIRTSFDDTTIITKAIENLDCIIDSEVLENVCPGMIEALSRSQNSSIAYWLMNRIQEYHTTIDSWYIETILVILAETRRTLDETYIQTQCDSLKQTLVEETDDIKLREMAVNTVYKLLLNPGVFNLSTILIQFSFWALGENGYLSSKYSDVDIMKQLQTCLQNIEDDYLQIYGLQAIKECISRSKIWLSGLEPILKQYIKSPIPEKQDISQHLLLMIQDSRYEKEVQKDQTSTNKLAANPNRPSNIGRFRSFEKRENEYPERIMTTSTPAILDINKSNHSSGLQEEEENQKRKPDLLSSLIEFELQEGEEGVMDTTMFGELWVKYKVEEKRRFECSVVKIEKLARRLGKTWRLEVIEMIGQEMIGVSKQEGVLIHIKMMTNQEFELTIRSKKEKGIYEFLKNRQLQ